MTVEPLSVFAATSSTTGHTERTPPFSALQCPSLAPPAARSMWPLSAAASSACTRPSSCSGEHPTSPSPSLRKVRYTAPHTRARVYTGTHTGTHRHTHACTRIHTHTRTNDAHPRSFRWLTPASTYCTHPGRGLGEGSSGYSSAVLRCFYSSDEMSRMAADGLQVHSAWRDYLKLASPEAQLSRVRSARGAAALTGCKADRRRLPCSL